MSIFKSTLKPFVVRQINTRQNLLAEIKRPPVFNQYVSGKMPWIKMSSFVDYKESQNLAKSYVLMGGTLYYKQSTGVWTSRKGVYGKGAAYGSELGTEQYGLRPMPGITSIKTRSLAAYGSLTESTIKFYAWDKKQLEELSILFMRPGYHVLLEWGWSLYLDTYESGDSFKDKTATNALKTSSAYRMSNSPFLTVDCFDPTLTQEGVYELLENYRVKYAGNYDGTLGSIKNFEYVLMPNGGYECTTVLISIGDVIDTIRINNTTSQKVDPVDAVVLGQQATGSGAEPELKTQFELLMDQYASLNEVYGRTNYPLINEIDNKILESDDNKIDRYIYRYDYFTDPTKQISQPIVISKDNKADRRSFKFIQLSYLIHILNYFKNIYGESQQKLFDIEIPPLPTDENSISNGLCLGSYNSISVDPSVCLIRNTGAELFSVDDRKGFDPRVKQTEIIKPKNIVEGIVNSKMKEYIYTDTNLGQIGNIYLNISKIVEIYKAQSRANNGYVYLGQYISEIMTTVSYALGSINDFDKFVNDNKIVIIDKHYTELPADAAFDSKYRINISGNNTIVRDHKIMSKIFPSQASMIATAAQDRENIAAIQTSTYNYLNKDIKSRLFKNLSDTDTSQEDIDKEADIFNNNMQALINYVDKIVLSSDSNAFGSTTGNYENNVGAMNAYLNSLLVQIDRGTDYKAIIPISVELKIDGVSGLTIGEIFTLNKDVLPKDYEDKKVGFIVTGISNEINNSSWTTNVTAMLCLLDQLQRQNESKQKAKDLLYRAKESSRKDVAATLKSIAYYKILAALYIDVLRENIIVKNLDGELEFKKDKNGRRRALYSQIAVQEAGGSEITYGDLLTEFSNTYMRLYPKTTSVDIKISNEGRNTNINTTETRLIGVYKNGVLENIIRNTAYYRDMKDASIKNVFNAEMSKVRSGYEKDAVPPDYTKVFDSGFLVLDYIKLIVKNPIGVIRSGANLPLYGTLSKEYTLTIFNTTFNLINAQEAINKITGDFIPTVPLVIGYPYFADKQ